MPNGELLVDVDCVITEALGAIKVASLFDDFLTLYL